MTREFEAARLENFKARADAVIDIKNRDPDDIEKRSNNRVRRALKFFIAGTAAACSLGAIVSLVVESGIVITGMLIALAALCIAMLAPLASGESISSNDVVRIMQAVRGMIRPDRPTEPKQQQAEVPPDNTSKQQLKDDANEEDRSSSRA